MNAFYNSNDSKVGEDMASTVEFFPSMEQFFDCDSVEDQSNTPHHFSEWDVVKIGTFVSRLESIQSSKSTRGVFKRQNESVPSSVVLRLANEVFGYNGWSSELLNSSLIQTSGDEEAGSYSAKFEVVVKIKLLGGLEHEGRATGRADSLPHKYMCYNNARKSAASEATKWALFGLKDVLIAYETGK